MDSHSQETLRKVEENDVELTTLWIGEGEGMFSSRVGDDFSRLGAAIGENTHITEVAVVLSNALALDVANDGFYDGLKLNSSVQGLRLYCNNNNTIAGGVEQKILEAYQESNCNLTGINIFRMRLQYRGEHILADTLRRFTNLQHIRLSQINITNRELLPIIEAVSGHRSLERLNLAENLIGNAGCETLATLLRNQNSNLQNLNLEGNNIGNEGVTTLANGLLNNTKLIKLSLHAQPMDQSVGGIFARLLCNKSNINETYSSNHTLEILMLPQILVEPLGSLLHLNKGTNKNHVAIKKILKCHPNMNMEPLFEWHMEGEDERNLKALPYIISWFEKAEEAVAGDEEEESYNIGERKLSAMYQFAKAMPLLFVPVSHNKGGDNKRKRDDK